MLIYPQHAVTCYEDHLTFQTIEKSQILLLDTGYQHTFFAELDKLKCHLFIDRNNFLPKGFYITFDLACTQRQTCNIKQMVLVSKLIIIFCFHISGLSNNDKYYFFHILFFDKITNPVKKICVVICVEPSKKEHPSMQCKAKNDLLYQHGILFFVSLFMTLKDHTSKVN